MSDVVMRVTEAPDAGERAGVRGLVAAVTAADGVGPLSEQGRLRVRELAEENKSVGHVLLWDGETLAGYGVSDGSGEAELLVDAGHRRRGYGRRLLTEVQQLGAERVWAHGRTPGAVALAASAGLVVVRELYRMTRPLAEPLPEVRLPAGITVRSFEPGADDAEWLAVNARAFAHHAEQGAFSQADLDARRQEPWFDPAGFFLAERDGAIVGFHWTKVDSEDRGEVYVVGVDPAAHGQGLGKVLTLVGLHHLRDAGLAEVELYVDGDNPAALGLYRGLGFTEADVDVMFGPATR